MSRAADLWTKLDAKRQPMLARLEGYASLTIPRLMEVLGADEQNSTLKPEEDCRSTSNPVIIATGEKHKEELDFSAGGTGSYWTIRVNVASRWMMSPVSFR